MGFSIGTNQWPPNYEHQIVALNKLICEQSEALDRLSIVQLILILIVGALVGIKLFEVIKKL